jgi:hypothetical protein
MTNPEIKSAARKNGININSIKSSKKGLLVSYYIFNDDKNYRTENRTTPFSTTEELEYWINNNVK